MLKCCILSPPPPSRLWSPAMCPVCRDCTNPGVEKYMMDVDSLRLFDKWLVARKRSILFRQFGSFCPWWVANNPSAMVIWRGSSKWQAYAYLVLLHHPIKSIVVGNILKRFSRYPMRVGVWFLRLTSGRRYIPQMGPGTLSYHYDQKRQDPCHALHQ